MTGSPGAEQKTDSMTGGSSGMSAGQQKYQNAFNFLNGGNIAAPSNGPNLDSYKAAVNYLNTRDPSTGRTPLEVYNEKQAAYMKVKGRWDREREHAIERFRMRYPDDAKEQKQALQDWDRTYGIDFKNELQSKYVDWIVNGKKNRVEQHIGAFDGEAFEARMEASNVNGEF